LRDSQAQACPHSQADPQEQSGPQEQESPQGQTLVVSKAELQLQVD